MIDGVSRTRAVLTAAVLLSALALGGCSDDEPEPKFAPPSKAPTSPSTTAASGPIEPTLPEAAKGDDRAAAGVFVRHYWEMVRYAEESGDLDGLRRLSSPQCQPCVQGIEYLEDVHAANGRISGGERTVTELDPKGFIRHNGIYSDAIVDFTVTTTPQVVDYSDRADEKYPGGRTRYTAVVRMRQDGWVMVNWSRS